jgi:Flp pilus assembly protein TadG
MLGIVSRLLRKLMTETGGAEIAEAAAVLPLMFMILLGIFWFGQAFRLYGTITRAAQEGARAGATPNCTTCGGTSFNAANAVSAVNSALAASNLDPTAVLGPTNPPSFNACSNGNNSCQTSGTSLVCVQEPIQLYNVGSLGGAGVCGIAVTFRYPYKFWLPFTSVNNQQIYLTASARMRMETQ